MCASAYSRLPLKDKKADVLRNYAFYSVLLFVILGAISFVSVIQQWWALSIVLAWTGLLMITVVMLLCSRYLARLLRTVEGKSRATHQRFVVETAREQRKEVQTLLAQGTTLAEQRQLLEANQEELLEQRKSIAALELKVHSSVGTTVRHVSSTVRHSTSEIEALLQIFSHFSELKLPMPATGGWALDAQSLAHLISLVEERRPRQILELGSGTSSIWLGYLCRSFGGKLITLDHLEEFLDKTRAEIDKHELAEFVETRLASLEEVVCDEEVFQWYSLEALSDLSDIDMVLVDGPPEMTGANARYPALPEILKRLSPNAVIVLDDAHRPDETDIINQWISRYPEFTRQTIGTSRLAVLSRGS